jgi:hypothetical protein
MLGTRSDLDLGVVGRKLDDDPDCRRSASPPLTARDAPRDAVDRYEFIAEHEGRLAPDKDVAELPALAGDRASGACRPTTRDSRDHSRR